MRIESLGSVTTNYQPIISSPADMNFEKVLSTTDIKDNEIENESSGNIYEEISSKYDVRSATFEEVAEIADSLYSVGEISLWEVAVLTFDYERATQSIKESMNGLALTTFNMYETAADKNGKRDWITEFEARATKDFKYGDLIAYSNKKKILNTLYQIER